MKRLSLYAWIVHFYIPLNIHFYSIIYNNLYALSQWFEIPIDAIICGNRKSILSQKLVIIENPRDRRLYSYYKKLNKLIAA